MYEITLYGTLGCHLCDDALTVITSSLGAKAHVTYVDIADDPQLVVSMGMIIPVVQYKHTSLHWPFTTMDIRQLVGISPKRRYLI